MARTSLGVSSGVPETAQRFTACSDMAASVRRLTERCCDLLMVSSAPPSTSCTSSSTARHDIMVSRPLACFSAGAASWS